jgi:hypothetical protein
VVEYLSKLERDMVKECRIYFGKKFYKQKYGYWTIKEWNKENKFYKTILAHRWVWENVNGVIPEKMDIHHIDGDKDNNEISNLNIVSRSEHQKKNHAQELKQKENLNKVRPLEWLKSDAGRKAVSEKGKQVWKDRDFHTIICEHCGESKEYKRWARFCSKKCYMKWRWINVLKPRS